MEKVAYDMASLYAEDQLKRLKFLYGKEAYAKIGVEKGMKDLIKVSGLSENPFLYECYQEQFSKIGSQNYVFPEQKWQRLTAVLGLHMGRFYYIDLPISRAIREHVAASGHEDLPPKTYNLGDLKAFESFSLRMSKWHEKFDGYFDDIRRLESGESDDLPDENYKLRYDLAGEVLGKLKIRLNKLLKPVQDPVKVAERNAALRKLVSEITRWPVVLSSFVWNNFEDLKKELKPKDTFAELILKVLGEAAYGESFDIGAFQRRVISYHLDAFNNFVKNDQQKRILQVIRTEIEELIQDE